jgi:Hypoxia induced protein conserved region
MFRARIYAQGFTLVALVGGSIFWKDDRMKRKELERALEEKRKAEKREKWLRELEQRDREDREWRARFEDTAARAKEAEGGGKSAGSRAGQMGTKVGESAQKVSKEGTKGAGARADQAVNKVEQGSEKVKEEGTKNAAAVAVQGIDKVEEGVEKVWNEAVDGAGKGKDRMKAAIDKPFPNKSVLEQVERTGWGRGMWSVKEARRRR